MLVKVAWRNVWRHKTRSGVIIFSVLFGLWSALLIQGYMNGMVEERVQTAIEKEISHLQIHHPDFKNEYDVKLIIDKGDKILQDLTGRQQVNAATGRVISKGMIATSTGSAGVKINGVNALTENSVTHLGKNIIQGSYLSEDKQNEILIGEKLLKKLKLKLKSKVVITLMDKENNIASGAFRIQGVFKTNNTPYDESNVFIKIPELSALTNTKNEINEIAVLLYTNDSLVPFCNQVKSKYPSMKTENWMEIAPEINLIVSASNQSMLIYMGIIMLALAFGIINTMLMAVLERTREIGMLMALGMSKPKVFTMILLETIFLVFIGTPFGALLGYATTTYYGHHGIDMSSYKDVYASFGLSEIMYPKLNPRDYWIMLELVVATSLISALFPARKALSLNPSEAIRK